MHRFGVTDAKFYQDVFVVMTACLEATTRLEVESLVTEPYVRNPAVTAAAIATMDDLSGGRAILGIGGGVESSSRVWTAPWGFERPHPVAAVREAVDVARRMWRGEEVTLRGEVVRVERARLSFRTRPDIPVCIAARSPRMLELAGEIADIVHIASYYLSIPWQREIIERVRAGASRAGRPSGSYEVDVTIACSVSADRDAARRAARRPAAKGVSWTAGADPYALKSWVRPKAFTAPDALVAAVARWDFRATRELPEEVDGLMTDEILDDFAVSGTPEECAERILALKRELPEMTGVRIDAVPPVAEGRLPYDAYIEMLDGYAEMARIVAQRSADSTAPFSASALPS